MAEITCPFEMPEPGRRRREHHRYWERENGRVEVWAWRRTEWVLETTYMPGGGPDPTGVRELV